MLTIIDQLRRSLAIRGPLGTLQMCAVNLRERINNNARAIESQRQETDAAFDREWNMDTGGIVRPQPGEVAGDNWRFGIRYQAVNPSALTDTLKNLRIFCENFTFIDFGSGKGRALLIAASFPFRRIIGVEYSRELNRIARENITRLPPHTKRCPQIDVVHSDAAQFPLPEGPLVLYFFNPFGRPVMQRVVENVAKSFRENPRRFLVVYFTPYEADLWSAARIFKRLKDSPAIFDTEMTLPSIAPAAG